MLVLQVVLVSSAFRDAEWEDTDVTSNLWGICSRHDTDALIEVLSDQSIVPPAAFARSKDGRGMYFIWLQILDSVLKYAIMHNNVTTRSLVLGL